MERDCGNCKHWIPWEQEKQMSLGYCGKVLRCEKDEEAFDDETCFEPKEGEGDDEDGEGH